MSKELGLWDVYCIATGAMFSSGFFLLPGLATATAGPSAVVAYLLAGLLMIPSMFSMLELSTALPRAGGAYYFLDRSLGPAVGTVTGVGTWLSLVLKSAFSLVGMGAYLAVIPLIGEFVAPDTAGAAWSIKLIAVALTVFFVVVNIFGSHQSARLQKLLVIAILGILGLFVVEGFWHVFTRMPEGALEKQYTPFLHAERGWTGLFSTVGLVFVSYAGLTKVASISEEVRKPERNLPWAMILSLATATAVYVGGVFIMIAVLEPTDLREDYTPVHTAATAFAGWPPKPVLPALVIIAALAAFASTGNAGILSASRYPLAMARDRLAPPAFEKVGWFGTPTRGILLTGGIVTVFIVAFSAEGVAKLGSTFNLFVFGLVNIAV
ncbi:MAG: APC family permease, partial [Candidatus Hydrogenedentota bacterium]